MSTKRPGDDENGGNGVTDTKKAKAVSISPKQITNSLNNWNFFIEGR